ncbi:MAG: Gfo/Idh/MocA family protein [Candidatus Roseilinea sp.]|uniref:Gfo/Idh/MocA family protein n=1 Tax=Candidatus Roseilinea sp. TaxID=2838777 RepID=UPI00404B2579
MEKARIALISAGWWGTYAHIPALQQHPQAELVVVQSRSREKADKIAADFNIPMACVTLDEVLAIEGLPGVIVSSTPNAHYEQARAALERGLHVLVEKPPGCCGRRTCLHPDLASGRAARFPVGV